MTGVGRQLQTKEMPDGGVEVDASSHSAPIHPASRDGLQIAGQARPLTVRCPGQEVKPVFVGVVGARGVVSSKFQLPRPPIRRPSVASSTTCGAVAGGAEAGSGAARVATAAGISVAEDMRGLACEAPRS